LVPEIIVPVVHHIPSPGASTATERGFAGPVQERRDSGTFYEILLFDVARAPAVGRINVLHNGLKMRTGEYFDNTQIHRNFAVEL